MANSHHTVWVPKENDRFIQSLNDTDLDLIRKFRLYCTFKNEQLSQRLALNQTNKFVDASKSLSMLTSRKQLFVGRNVWNHASNNFLNKTRSM